MDKKITTLTCLSAMVVAGNAYAGGSSCGGSCGGGGHQASSHRSSGHQFSRSTGGNHTFRPIRRSGNQGFQAMHRQSSQRFQPIHRSNGQRFQPMRPIQHQPARPAMHRAPQYTMQHRSYQPNRYQPVRPTMHRVPQQAHGRRISHNQNHKVFRPIQQNYHWTGRQQPQHRHIKVQHRPHYQQHYSRYYNFLPVQAPRYRGTGGGYNEWRVVDVGYVAPPPPPRIIRTVAPETHYVQRQYVQRKVAKTRYVRPNYQKVAHTPQRQPSKLCNLRYQYPTVSHRKGGFYEVPVSTCGTTTVRIEVICNNKRHTV